MAFQVIGFGFEAFVFAYLGLSFFAYADLTEYPWSWSFILIELLICIVARFLGTVCLLYLLVLLGHKKGVTFKQLVFISYGGVIRGAIAFGLVLKLDEHQIPDERIRNLITSTALTLVVSTTVVFGSAMPLVQSMLVPPKESEKHEYDETDNNSAEETGETSKKIAPSPHQIEHEEFIHPNAMKASEYDSDINQNKFTRSQFAKERKRKLNSCKSCLKRFDDLVMRPFMIY